MTLKALINARIIDCTGADPIEGGAVIIEGERIKEVLDTRPGSLPDETQVLDCRGRCLTPGLIDCHVHVGSVEADIAGQMRSNFPSYTVIHALKKIQESLDQGFTSLRDAGGADFGYKKALMEGSIPGPRLFISGRIISQTGGHADWRLPAETYPPVEHAAGWSSSVADGVDAVRKACRENIRQGADFIKIMAGGGAMSPSDEIDTSQYSMEELKAIVFEAENAGTYVAAHCYSDRSIQNCLKAGVRTIEHGNLMTRPSAQAIKDAKAYLVPTMVTYEKLSELGANYGVPAYNIAKINQALEKAVSSLELAYKTGCKIGAGSDLLGPMQIYKARELELQAQVMGNMGALMASTKTNAEIIKQAHNLGTIEAGKLADLLVVEGDPLQDIGLFQDYKANLCLIMQGGELYRNQL